MFRYALVSVSDKTGLIKFLRPFVEQGLKVVSTGGTAEFLKRNGVSVLPVSEVTGFPEVMDGRVRTLHPRIYMSLLARSYNEADMRLLQDNKLWPFDLVVGNLYPFGEASQKNLSDRDLVEFIDIGGPSLLRAAAKNFESITVICDPSDYEEVSARSPLDISFRKKLAAKVFAHVSAYDGMIAMHLGKPEIFVGKEFSLTGKLVDQLRYGENPQQKAYWFCRTNPSHGLHEAEILQGKKLSYNNIVDLEAASRTLVEFAEPCMVAVKHANPCGVAVGADVREATQKCIQSDPVSVFGGILATNQSLTLEAAEVLENIFLEAIVAPDFSHEALVTLSRKKNLRLLRWKGISQKVQDIEVKTVRGGFLVQTSDQTSDWGTDWKIIGKEPIEPIKRDLMFAWRVCAHLKSNAIAIAGNGQTLGLGMGQVNRVEAVEHALQRKAWHHKNFSGTPVLASDAFFPFADSIEKIGQAGIKWIIQPGGSLRDEEVIARAKELGINMILTGVRHFYH